MNQHSNPVFQSCTNPSRHDYYTFDQKCIKKGSICFKDNGKVQQSRTACAWQNNRIITEWMFTLSVTVLLYPKTQKCTINRLLAGFCLYTRYACSGTVAGLAATLYITSTRPWRWGNEHAMRVGTNHVRSNASTVSHRSPPYTQRDGAIG